MAARCVVHCYRSFPSLYKMQTLNSRSNLACRTSLPFKGGVGLEVESRLRARKSSAAAFSGPFREPWLAGERRPLWEGKRVRRIVSTCPRARRKTGIGSPVVREPLPEKELELEVQIGIEEEIPEDDEEVLNFAEILRLDVPRATKLALDRLKNSTSTTRDRSVDNLSAFDTAELSVLLCNDNFIQRLNKDWRDKDAVTDVLSMSQHIPGLQIPVLMLGDIVISVDTAARQAEEREQTLIDEIRILFVHGLLHLLGYDHELGEEAEKEMEKEEEFILSSLGWKGKGLIHSTYE